MSNPAHGRLPMSQGSASESGGGSPLLASSPVSVTVQPAGNVSFPGSCSPASSCGPGKDKSALPPVYLILNDQSGKEQGPPSSWDDARTADVWLSSLHSVIFIITCALAAFILFRNVLTW